jgi:hypothetical protein
MDEWGSWELEGIREDWLRAEALKSDWISNLNSALPFSLCCAQVFAAWDSVGGYDETNTQR